MSPRRARILFLLPSLTGGGAQRVFSTLLQHLDRGQFELHLGLLKVKGPYLEEIPDDVAVHDLKSSRVRFALPSVLRLAWKIKPDALLSTLAHLNLALILGRHLLPVGTRVLIREASLASSLLVQEKQFPALWGWLYRQFYRRADMVVCLCDAMVHDLVSHFDLPREKIVRIYNPVDIDKVQSCAENGDNPYTGDGPQIIAIGRLCRAKGFDLLLNAIPAVVQRFPTAQLTILGEGSLLSELAEQVRRLGLQDIVHFPGFQANPWRYLRHADVFVLSSRYEGMPNTLLEAVALGVPSVASDCPGGVREISAIDTRVVLVPPEDVPALKSAIIGVLIEQSHSHQESKTHLKLKEKFGLQTILREYSNLLSAQDSRVFGIAND